MTDHPVRLKACQMPNFIGLVGPGVDDDVRISVSLLTEEQAKSYSRQLAADFIEHWREKQRSKALAAASSKAIKETL